MRAKWSAPIRKYWKISEQMMVKYCDLEHAHCFKIDVPQIGPAQAIYYDVAALKACCEHIKKNHIPHLRNEKAKAEQKLRSCQHREKILERQMSKLNRRERVHRLCTRAGMLESFLVCPGELTDDQVMELLKISFRQPEVVLALAKMVHDVHERGNVQNPLE